MWKCKNCSETIEDRYLHCWSCGKPKPESDEAVAVSEPEIEMPAVAVPPVTETVKAEPPPAEKFTAEPEAPPKPEVLPETHFLFERDFAGAEKPPSGILSLLLPLLWLAAVGAAAAFTYYTGQKRAAFEKRIAEAAQNLNAQKNQFAFSKDAPRERGPLRAKVLPLKASDRELDVLYNYLPDDLRPAAPEEVKTVLWLDCSADKVWDYGDGTVGYREKCNAYLVDRATAKIVDVRNFLGEMPPLSKKQETGDASGKVLAERYISFIREHQPENERRPERSAADSPDHHFYHKSELLYSIILLALLGAVGVGWLFFKLKSAVRKAD